MFNVLKINSKAPEFELKGYYKDQFKTFKLSEFEESWTVLFFYPGDFGETCSQELQDFEAKSKEFESKNIRLVSCSTDSPKVHKAWAESLGGISFPMLSDVHHSACIDYGVFVDEEAKALRGTFIIDPNGNLKWYQISDTSIARSADDVLKIVSVFQSKKI